MDLKKVADSTPPIGRPLKALPIVPVSNPDAYLPGIPVDAPEPQQTTVAATAPTRPRPTTVVAPAPPPPLPVASAPVTIAELGETGPIVTSRSLTEPVVTGHTSGPIPMLEEPVLETPVARGPVYAAAKPAAVEQPPDAPAVHHGILANPFHAFHRLENRVLRMAGKDDPAITYEPVLNRINELGPSMHALTDEQLKAKTAEFRKRLESGEKMDSVLPEAFAAIREAAQRTTGMKPFDMQMLGGIIMAHGMVAEMGTGEGKTLAAVAPAYLHGLTGKGSHIITVNDTLAKRDAATNTPIFNAMGLSVGFVANEMTVQEKQKGFNADITYLTNSTGGFGYLGDNMAKQPEDVVEREFNFGLVDEVDEILIDEARTPLIIAKSTVPSEDLYDKYNGVVEQLKRGEDYEVDYKKKTCALTDAGQSKVEKIVGMDLWASSDLKSLDEAVKQGQAQGKPVTIEFGSKDEADLYTDRLKAEKRKFLASDTACAHPVDVIGITYEDAPTAHKARPAQDNALILKSSQFNHMDQIPYLDQALKAQTLFERDRDYVVQERPEWAQQREMAKADIVFNQLTPAEQKTMLQEADRRLNSAISKLATGNAPDGPLKQWWDLMDPKPDAIPDSVRQAQYDAEGFELMAERLKNMPPDQKAALEQEARKIVGNDPQAKVNIVDEFTGRVLPGRRYSQGLHQAIEAKEHVEVQAETQTMASITYPNLFRLYPILAGMSGTAKSEEEELIKLYNMPVGVVPPNKPSQRKDLEDQIYMTRAEKYRAIVDQIEKLHNQGVSVLTGTRSIEVNTDIAKLCKQRGLPINVLNAESVKNNTAQENDIIARAGKSGAITIATNMAGRGVDIKPDKLNFMMMTREASNVLGQSAMASRLQTLEGLFAKLPADRQAALNKQIETEVAAEFRTQQRNALADKLSDQEVEDIRKTVGDPAEIGMNAYRDKTLQALDERLDKLSAKDRNALVGEAPSAETRRNIRGVVITREMALDPNISPLEANVGVGITFNPSKPGENPSKVFEQVDKMAGWLREQGLPVRCQEPGVSATDLPNGTVTLIYPGAAQHAATPPADFEAGPPLVPLPSFAQPGAHQPGVMLDSSKFPSQGLYVIGTERHESLRIDRQLQGRSGRQGDPGTTQFFLSMDDELMRFFGGDGLRNMVQKMGMKDGEALSNRTVSNAIRKAQKAVEGRDFDSRTNTTKYDGVQNQQRETVYKERRKVLMGYDLTNDVRDWADDRLDSLAADFKNHRDKLSADDAVALSEQIKETFGLKVEPDGSKGYKAFMDSARKTIHDTYDAKMKDIGTVGLRDRFLSQLDDMWHYHLDSLADLQTGIGWVSVAQKNPEVEFKIQAGHMFEDLIINTQDAVLDSIFKPDAENTDQPAA